MYEYIRKKEINCFYVKYFQVKEGWEPLCSFLDMPVPDEPFPRFNDTATITKMKENYIKLSWY
jgi:hypothetical protein